MPALRLLLTWKVKAAAEAGEGPELARPSTGRRALSMSG